MTPLVTTARALMAAPVGGAAAPTNDLLATSLAPTGALATLAGLVLAIVAGIRKIRTDGYADAMTRAKAAEEREQAVREDLLSRLEGVESEVRNLRKEQQTRDRQHAETLRTQEDRHRDERDRDQRQLLVQTHVNFRLTQMLAQHGIDLPEELDPAKPHVPLRIDPTAD